MTDEAKSHDPESEAPTEKGTEPEPTAEKTRAKWGKTGVAVGIGSAAIVAALLYTNRHHRKK